MNKIKINKDLKTKSDSLFLSLGLDTNTAVNIFLTKCINEGGIPFEIKEKDFNEETIEALKEADEMKNNKEKYKRYDSVDEAFKEALCETV